MVNHFEKSGLITTKIGLVHSIRELVWFKAVDINTFFPKCYDVNDAEGLDEFVEEFKVVQAESLLKQAWAGKEIPIEVVMVALTVTLRRLRDFNDLLDCVDDSDCKLIKDPEWALLNSEWTSELLAATHSADWFQQLSLSLPLSAVQSRIPEVLAELKSRFPQFSLNGEQNAWIIKPASLSMGRGISCHNDLDSILSIFSKTEGMWVVQKYIENPLVLIRKKFDIRQWILVTNWNPLTVWFYERCYLRFSVEDFSMENISNKFVHLTNNSISKNSKHFDRAEIQGCMWHSEQFAEYLQRQHGRDVWGEELKPKIKEIALSCLECVQDSIENRKNSFELYGIDLMISDDLKPWLIEVQASPSMEHSTEVTAELVGEVLEDCIKVVVDYGSARKKSGVDTGNFTLLHKQREVKRPSNALGSQMVCEGRAIRR
jgi:tubulin monoglycylase TTLL3/8